MEAWEQMLVSRGWVRPARPGYTVWTWMYNVVEGEGGHLNRASLSLREIHVARAHGCLDELVTAKMLDCREALDKWLLERQAGGKG